eukprot:c27904_g1_i1 orf=878-1570(+)
MSSLRNSVKRRAHKERAQPGYRKKYGLLEKHKDYVLRARDFHRKEETINLLRQKAADKNPDEFYYKMINSKSVGGIHRPQSTAKQYTHEELQLMKTQDIGYVLNKVQSEQKKVERLRAVLHSLDQPQSNKHVYFADDREEVKDLKELLSSRQLDDRPTVLLPKRIRKKQEAAYKELEERIERLAKMRSIVMTMTFQKELMGKGRKRKLHTDEIVTPSEIPVYKWRRERKK